MSQSNTKPVKYWLGNVPARCDISGDPITDAFIDGRTVMGPWACMHPDTHKQYGVGLGIGSGQRYERVALEDGSIKWQKVAG